MIILDKLCKIKFKLSRKLKKIKLLNNKISLQKKLKKQFQSIRRELFIAIQEVLRLKPKKDRNLLLKQGKKLYKPNKGKSLLTKQNIVQRFAKEAQALIEGDFKEETTTQESYKRYPIKKAFRGAITGTTYKIDFPIGMLVEVEADTGQDKVKIRMKRYGKHYTGKVSRSLIDWTAVKEFHPEEELSEDFTKPGWKPINKLGIAYKDQGVFLRDKPLPEGDGSLKTGYLNQNDKAMVLHQNTETGWCFVSNTLGQLGYVAASHLWVHLPEPDAQVKKIRSGETALEIAQNYYQGTFNRWGEDKRFLVNALVYANQKYNLNADSNGGNKQPAINKANPNDSWDKTKAIAGQYIWLPSATYLDTLKGQVSSGSYTYEAYQGALSVMEGAYKFVAYGLGFVGGLVHGAIYNIYEKLADIAQSVVGLFQSFWKLVTGELWKDLKQMGDAIYKIISDPKQLKEFMKELAQGLFGAILGKIAKLTSSNPWEAGHAAGYLTGYVGVEILLAIFTGGAALLTKLAKLGKLGVIIGKVVGKAQALAKKVPNPFNRRKKKTGKKDRNDEKDGNKLIEKQKALVMAKMITEGHDKADTPIPALMASLQVVKKKYSVVKDFYSKPKGNGHYEIWMKASDLEVDGDYTPGDDGRIEYSVADIVSSAERIQKGRTTRGVQALSKKIGRGDAAYSGLKATKENVQAIIKEVMESSGKISNVTRNQQGIEIIDYFNPSTGQGIRLIKETGAFDTFINY